MLTDYTPSQWQLPKSCEIVASGLAVWAFAVAGVFFV